MGFFPRRPAYKLGKKKPEPTEASIEAIITMLERSVRVY
jgi:hypothetical protein